MVWDVYQNKWYSNYELLKDYFKKNDYTVIRSHSQISVKKNKIDVTLEPSEIIVLYSDKK